MIAFLADPNLAFLLLITGALGLYWELHTPGAIFPGVIGAVLLCAGAFSLFEDTPTWYGSVMILAAFVFLAAELKVGGHGVSGALGSGLLALGAIALLPGPHRISPALAITVSLALCLIAVFLGYLGLRARKNSLLTGIDTLVGKIGVSRTEINFRGTVFVDGEYWQAISESSIPAGARILIERVQGLTLYVKEA